MKPAFKLLLILSVITSLNFYLGFDLRFTIINLVWCIPIAYDWNMEVQKKRLEKFQPKKF